MNSERFASLADAYGGRIDRWPDADQADARAFWAAHRGEASRILAAAEAVDGLLGASAEPVFSGVLRERILSAAAPTRTERRLRAPGRLFSGLGLAAACVAGVLFGSSLSDQIIGDPALEALDQASTSFDAVYSLEAEDAG